MTSESDLNRSEWEGMAGQEPESLREDPLSIFLSRVKDEFLQKQLNAKEVQDAIPVMVERMSEDEKSELINLAKLHFVPAVCKLHTPDIINYSEYSDPDEKVEITLSPNNIAQFLIGEGSNAFREHLKFQMKYGDWKELEDVEIKRHMEDDLYNAGVAG